MLAVRALLCREVAPLQRALQRVLGRSNASAPKVLAASSKLQAAQQAGLPQCLRVGLSHGLSAKPFSSATEQQRQADIVHVDVQPQEKDLHEGGVQSLASLKAAAEAHVPSGTANIGTIPILSLNGETVGSFELPADIFGQDIRRDILQRVVRWQLAKRQQGTHSTKGRSEVRGGGRKPIPQKKTGNARAGSIRSPLWRGGGVIHGPRPRSHAIGLQKKIRRLGMKVALSAKAKEGRLIILDSAYVESGKTRDVAAHVSVLLANAPRQSILFCDSGKEAPDGGKMLRRSIRNLIWVDALPSQGLNVYSILQRDYLAITAEAAYRLMERLRRPIQR